MSFKENWITECKERRKKGTTKRVAKGYAWMLCYWLLSFAVLYLHFTEFNNETVGRLVCFAAIIVVARMLLAAFIYVFVWISASGAISQARKLTGPAPRHALDSQESPEQKAHVVHRVFDPVCRSRFGCFNGINNSVDTLSEMVLVVSLIASGWTWCAALFSLGVMIVEVSGAGIVLNRDEYFKLLDNEKYTTFLTETAGGDQ